MLTVEQRRERARKFLENFNAADAREFEELIAENFTFEIVSAMKEFPPIKGRREFAEKESATLRALFPQGLGLVLDAIICEGEHVAALAHCDTVANNGKPYRQRYNFYLRFEGDLIAEGREYNDTDLVRRVFVDQ